MPDTRDRITMNTSQGLAEATREAKYPRSTDWLISTPWGDHIFSGDRRAAERALKERVVAHEAQEAA
jgi:hypothetical protein